MGKKRRIPQRLCNGLTVVELLVAVSILAILAGLSLSFGGTIRKRMLDTKCANNLRSLAHAGRLFAYDHNGEFTHRNFMHGVEYPNKTTGVNEPGLREYAGIPQRTVGQDTVFTCSSSQRIYPTTAYAENRTYAINAFATRDYSSRRYLKFTSVPMPSAMAYLMDGPMPSLGSGGYSYTTRVRPEDTGVLFGPHNGLNHVVFLDGHVEALTPEKINSYTSSDPFWRGGTD